MPFARVDDILQRIRGFHRDLIACYQQTAALAEDDRMTWLLDYMGRHEAEFDRALAKFQDEDPDATRMTWLQYSADEHVRRALEETKFTPDLPADELIRRALWVDEAMRDLYGLLASSMAPPRVKRLFEHLVEAEREKSKKYTSRLTELQEEVGATPSSERP